MLADFDSLRQLPIAEKLLVVEALWDDIAASSEEFPLPPWLRAEVEQRVAELDGNPRATVDRQDLWQRVDKARG